MPAVQVFELALFSLAGTVRREDPDKDKASALRHGSAPPPGLVASGKSLGLSEPHLSLSRK